MKKLKIDNFLDEKIKLDINKLNTLCEELNWIGILNSFELLNQYSFY